MIELKKIIELFDSLDLSKTRAAMATVVKVYGSAYRRPGARMLITEGGNFIGTISGGCLEGDALAKAKMCIAEQKPTLITYDTRDDSSAKVGANLGCNGMIDVLLEPITNDSIAISIIRNHLSSNYTTTLALIYDDSLGELTGMRIVFGAENEQNLVPALAAQIAANLLQSSETGHSFSETHNFDGRDISVFYETIKPQVQLIIFGSGLDSHPIISFAKQLGWKVLITSDSYTITEPHRFEGADDIRYIDRKEILENIEISNRTFCILISHNYKYDFNVLKTIIHTDTPYIGILGPRKRAEKILNDLKENNINLNDNQLEKIFSPIGLEIGGDNPEEIALSIVSEIQTVIHGKSGGSLRNKKGPIHDREKE